MKSTTQNNYDSHGVPLGMQSGTTILQQNLALSYKVKHTFTIHIHLPYVPSNPTLRYLSKRNENIYSQKDFYDIVHCSYIYNHQKLETMMEMSIMK